MKAKPPCAEWSMWLGPEIEGTASRGVQTLFIRSLSAYSGLKITDDLSFLARKANRVWFCKEFTNWVLMQAIAKHFQEVCVEVEPKCFENIPLVIRQRARIYLKVAVPLKPGDHICVGPAFEDESFAIGQGIKVDPKDYYADRRII
jgi:hypothetical protein